MALQYRKVVRDAILALLDASYNTTLNALAVTYGITPSTLDFTTASKNFAVSFIDPSQVENCQIQFGDEVQVGGCLYTSEANDTGAARGVPFDGAVMAHLDLYIRDREGMEGFDTESYFDAYEDAALSVLNDPANQWPVGVIFARQTKINRQHLVPLGDGFYTYIPISMAFQVMRTSL